MTWDNLPAQVQQEFRDAARYRGQVTPADSAADERERKVDTRDEAADRFVEQRDLSPEDLERCRKQARLIRYTPIAVGES